MGRVPHPEQDSPLLRLLGLATRQLATDLNDKLLEAGITDHRDSWNNVMPHIPASGIRLTELAARANMTKQAMAELVAEIERRGYLQPRPTRPIGAPRSSNSPTRDGPSCMPPYPHWVNSKLRSPAA